MGRIVRESQNVAGTDQWVAVTYEPAGERSYRETSLGHTERVQRDAMGARVRTLLDGNHQIDHVNDILSREVQRRLPGGGMLESGFDRMGRLAQRVVRSPAKHRSAGPDEPEWVGGMPEGVTSYTTYQYDLDGELIEKNDLRRGKTEYRYDPVGQLLASVPAKAREEVFRYDPAGNIYEAGDKDPQRRYGRGNRLLQKGNTQYEWDGDGRLSCKREITESGERVWQYGWNGAGLLQKVDTPDGKHVEFSYDPFARRIEKRVAETEGDRVFGTTTRFVWDGDALAHEVRRRAVENGDEIVDERAYLFEDDGIEPVAERVDGRWVQHLKDPVATVTGGVHSSGQVLERDDLSVWGGTKASDGLSFGLQGHYIDCEEGLEYVRHRYWDPDTMRWLSPDPLGLDGDSNAFRFDGSPTHDIDPFGLARMKMAGKRHKKTGVRFDKTGNPVFDSLHNKKLPKRMCNPSVSDDSQMKFATRDLKKALEKDPRKRRRFTKQQLDDIENEEARITGLTWHHHQDGRTLQLVDRKTHAKTGYDGGRQKTGGRRRKKKR